MKKTIHSQSWFVMAFCLWMGTTLKAQDFTLDGSLGLGTNPESKLDVDGDTKMRGDAELEGELKLKGLEGEDLLLNRLLFVTPEGKVLKVDGDLLTDQIAFELYQKDCGEGEFQSPFWNNGPNKLFLECDVDAKVGIGTANPTTTLTVFGDGWFTEGLKMASAQIEESADIGTNLRVNSQFEVQSTGLIRTYGGHWHILESERLTEDPNDGDATETSMILRRNGSIKTFLSSDAGSFLESFRYGESDFFFKVRGTGEIDVNLNSEAEHALRITKNGNEKVFLVDDNGEVYAKKVTVSLGDDWPDYVFDKEHERLPLKQLRAYIEEHGHLPNFPSAKEVEEQGMVDLGEMNRLLVEKVEELTLYILELEEMMESQRTAIEALSK